MPYSRKEEQMPPPPALGPRGLEEAAWVLVILLCSPAVTFHVYAPSIEFLEE